MLGSISLPAIGRGACRSQALGDSRAVASVWLFETAVGRIVVPSILIAALTSFFRVYGDPARDSFERKSWKRIDINCGAELALAALVAYFTAIADSAQKTPDVTEQFHSFFL